MQKGQILPGSSFGGEEGEGSQRGGSSHRHRHSRHLKLR